MNSLDIAQRLVAWHEVHQRDLPWRIAAPGARDAYTVWISEIMLQQTRVEAVIDYYNRWMARFPTVEALAAADLQEVLKAWAGLGYYARARNLHKAAQQIVAEYDGQLPDERNALLALPGIGEYTVGAILSLAFNHHEAILDGNVKRVLSRLADIAQPITETATLKLLWQRARELVEVAPSQQAGACNEAIMELGALICTPTNPRCLICPVHTQCAAVANGTQHERPVIPPKKQTPHYDVAAGIIWQGEPYQSKLLIAQRPPDGMLGGLWEFPGGKLEEQDADLAACLQREIREELAMEIAVGKQLTTVKHAYTHFRITLHAFHARHLAGEPQTLGVADWRWVELVELETFPFPVTDQKIIEALRGESTAD
ncbi:MAG TPA: A/G-specific adenine glycosylase [Caldilineaceae bacterium]|nr:A/G-specific adenine glycosylase [Caldilineaceae bacterium]